MKRLLFSGAILTLLVSCLAGCKPAAAPAKSLAAQQTQERPPESYLRPDSASFFVFRFWQENGRTQAEIIGRNSVKGRLKLAPADHAHDTPPNGILLAFMADGRRVYETPLEHPLERNVEYLTEDKKLERKMVRETSREVIVRVPQISGLSEIIVNFQNPELEPPIKLALTN